MTKPVTAVVKIEDINVVVTMSVEDARRLCATLGEFPAGHATDAIWEALDEAIGDAERIVEMLTGAA
jgi:hypothetical protein